MMTASPPCSDGGGQWHGRGRQPRGGETKGCWTGPGCKGVGAGQDGKVFHLSLESDSGSGTLLCLTSDDQTPTMCRPQGEALGIQQGTGSQSTEREHREAKGNGRQVACLMGEAQGVGAAGEAPRQAGESGKVPRKELMRRHEGGVGVRTCGVTEGQLGCSRQKEGP